MLALTRGGVLLSWGNGQQGQLGRVGSRMRELMATILRPHPVPFTRRLRGIPVPKVLKRHPLNTYFWVLDSLGVGIGFMRKV